MSNNGGMEMPREQLTVRIKPSYARWIEKRAEELNRSVGYIVEELVYNTEPGTFGADVPGRRVEVDDEHE